jgi:hypothetical protein
MSAVEIPVGWYLVPEIPTELQMQAGLYQSSHDSEYSDVCQSYMDMVRTPVDAPEISGLSWQPIEAAPTDGTSILAIVAGNHPMSGKPFIPEVVEWTDDGWWSCMWGGDPDSRGRYEPTHWMPLPAAPSLSDHEESQ